MKKRLPEYADLCNANPIFKGRLEGVGHLDLAGCLALGLTGPVLRSTGYPWDLRKTQPYCGYEDYDFDVADLGHLPTPTAASGSGSTRCGSR